MKICVLTHTFPRSLKDSNAAFMHALIMGLKKNGHEVTVLVPYSNGLKTHDFPYRVVAYKYIWPNSFHILGYSKTLKNGSNLKFSTYFLAPFFILSGIFSLINLSRREKFDIISSHWILPNGFFAFVVSKLLKIPYIVSLPGSDVYLAKKNKIFSIVAKISAIGASSIISDSPRFLNEILSLGINSKKTEIIPYPVIVDKTKPSFKNLSLLRKKLGFDKDTLVVMAVGRLVYKKGFEYLIKAMLPLIKKFRNTKLVIVGDGDLREKLEDLVLKLKLSSRVIFTGNINRDQIKNYYTLGDIFAAPSIKDENGNIDDQPVSLIEAMACEKPIVATDFPGIALTVKHGINGFLFPEKNVKALTSCIEKLISSKQLRIKMGKESKKIVLNHLTEEKIGRRYSKFIIETLKLKKNDN